MRAPLATFFALAYLIAWGLVPVLAVIARQSAVPDWQTLHDMGENLDFDGASLSVPGWTVYAITRVQDFAFTISGLVVTAIAYGRAGLVELGRRLVRWRIRWYWYLAALLPFGWYLVAAAVTGALPSFEADAALVRSSLVGAEYGFVVFLLLRGAMGEEIGLRGFALPRLQARMTPGKASLVLGVLWALWHLPVLPGRSLAGIVFFLLSVLALSYIFTWLFNGSSGSLIPVLILHAAQNSAGMVEAYFPTLTGSNWELVSLLGLLTAGAVVGMAVDRPRRARRPSCRTHGHLDRPCGGAGRCPSIEEKWPL